MTRMTKILDEFLTVLEFASEKDSSDDDDQPAASAASQRVHDSSSSDDYSQGDCNLAWSSKSPRAKRLRTKKRLVNSIDAALDPTTMTQWNYQCPRSQECGLRSLGQHRRRMWRP